MNFRLFLWKRRVEDIILLPFIITGRLIAQLKPLSKSYKVYFFFPFYHTGGAEKIHAQIARACGGKECIIFFTRKSQDDTFYQEFLESGCTIKDISTFTDNKIIYFVNLIFRGLISGYINKQAIPPVVFNGQCNFAYKLSPWIRKEVTQIDLIHSLNTFSYIRIPFIPFYKKTVIISRIKLQAHKELYLSKGVPELYINRFVYIINAVDFPKRTVADKNFEDMRILFNARQSPEKRFPLFLSIASKLHTVAPQIKFGVIGEMGTVMSDNAYSFIQFYGGLKDAAYIQELYFKSHILILTSTTEGLPLVVLEAMANGCAVLATPVGDLPLIIKNEEQGYLFSSIDNEQKIVEEAVRFTLELYHNRDLLKQIAAENITYANKNFTIEQFNAAYQSLIYNPR